MASDALTAIRVMVAMISHRLFMRSSCVMGTPLFRKSKTIFIHPKSLAILVVSEILRTDTPKKGVIFNHLMNN
jgi:hypothetical protein